MGMENSVLFFPPVISGGMVPGEGGECRWRGVLNLQQRKVSGVGKGEV